MASCCLHWWLRNAQLRMPTEDGQRLLQALGLGGVVRIEHAACFLLVDAQAARELDARVVLLRNGWWVTQKTLTHPTFGCLSQDV